MRHHLRSSSWHAQGGYLYGASKWLHYTWEGDPGLAVQEGTLRELSDTIGDQIYHPVYWTSDCMNRVNAPVLAITED